MAIGRLRSILDELERPAPTLPEPPTSEPPDDVPKRRNLKPTPLDGNTVLKSSVGPGKPAFSAWLGPPGMKDYVVQADVRVDGKRRLSNIGVTNQRYDMVLKARRLD